MANDFYTSRPAMAQKDYRCSECLDWILIGTRYERATHGWDGRVDRLKVCMACVDKRQTLATDAQISLFSNAETSLEAVGQRAA